jgi:hypothetical protein
VAQIARIDIALQVGASSESITVQGDAALLKTESAEQSTTINTERIKGLPLNFAATQGGAIRNPLAFATLPPGAYIHPGAKIPSKLTARPQPHSRSCWRAKMPPTG